jgi:hypothetical protein
MRGVFFALLALAAAVGPALLARRGGAAYGRLGYGLAPTALEFAAPVGEFEPALSGDVVEHEFAFRNGGAEPVRIVAAEGTCGCLHAVPSARRIEPGAAGAIRARFLTDGRYGPQTLRLKVRTDEGDRTGAVLTLRGRVRAVLRPRPGRIHLGVLEPGTRHTRRIEVLTYVPVADVRLEPRLVRAEIESRDVGRFTVRVDVDVAARAGASFGGVTLDYDLPTLGGRRQTWIPVVWSVAPPLRVEPETLVLVDGRGTLRVTPRAGVKLVDVDAGALPFDITRAADGDAIRLDVVNTGKRWEIPAGAALRLLVEPDSYAPVEVPVTLAEER